MKQFTLRGAVALTCAVLCWAVPANAATVEVAAVGLTFVPADVKINPGDSVHWTGLVGGFHTVAEVDTAISNTWNNGFHSAAFAGEFTLEFNTPGVFHYICEPHVFSGMRGTVTVNAPEPIPTVSDWGLIVTTVLVIGVGIACSVEPSGRQWRRLP